MKQLAKKNTFARSHHQPSTDSSGMSQPWNGLSQPPTKKIEVRKLIRIMFAYSARKNSANADPEYSTMWPATISDSPSTTSNGARLVSATPEMKYTTNSGSIGTQNHSRKPELPDCAITMSVRLRLPAPTITPTIAKPIAISYETTCAAARIAPRNAYFEFDAQPARMMPYTPSEVIASRYNRPALAFDNTAFASNGTTAQAANAGARVSSGASLYRNDSALVGWITSLNSSLNTSA